jgi:sugar/nucleoside kinase (ribokinase family)
LTTAPGQAGEGAKRRLGVLGTLVWDRIHHPASGGGVVEQWGGITYSLAALAAASPAGWIVEPLLKVGEDLAEEAGAFLARIEGLSLAGGMLRVPEPTNRVELTYTDSAHRGERLTGGVPSWRWDELEPLLESLDALYLNFISGFELELETARLLRARFAGPIYADLHSLFLGCPGAGVRQQRVPPQWEEWIACFDAIQLNEAELSLLAGPVPLDRFATDLLDRGPSIVVVTLGERGARIETRPGPLFAAPGGERISLHVPIAGEPLPGDPTGCGDVWGSTFLAGLLERLELRVAAERAHDFAARKIAAPGIETLADRLRLNPAPVRV